MLDKGALFPLTPFLVSLVYLVLFIQFQNNAQRK